MEDEKEKERNIIQIISMTFLVSSCMPWVVFIACRSRSYVDYRCSALVVHSELVDRGPESKSPTAPADSNDALCFREEACN